MKRLVDESGLLAGEQKLADLFRAAPPFEVDPFRKRRVLVSLSRIQSGGARVRFWLRPIGALVLLVSGSAAAAIGHRYVAHGSGFFGLGLPSATSSVAAPTAKSVARAPTLPAKADADTAVEPAASAEEPSVADNSPATDPMTAHPAQKSPHPRPSSSEDPSHVVEAIQALRTDKDPSRAQGLLNDYLKTHPNGVLSEDALALSIEAASAQHDPKAADYAKRYLAKFPHGKYRALASRALVQAGH